MNTDQERRFENAIAFAERAHSNEDLDSVDPASNLRWEQGDWLGSIGTSDGGWCGTSCCVAGYAIVEAAREENDRIGYVRPKGETEEDMAREFASHYAVQQLGVNELDLDELRDDGDDDWLNDVASSLMGLNSRQAGELFNYNNDVQDVLRHAKHIREDVAAERALSREKGV